MEVNGRPQLQIEVAERKLLHVSLSMSPGILSQFTNLQCISDRIQDLPVSTGRWEVASGKWQVSQRKSINGSQWKAKIANSSGGAKTAVCVSEYESGDCESIRQLTVY